MEMEGGVECYSSLHAIDIGGIAGPMEKKKAVQVNGELEKGRLRALASRASQQRSEAVTLFGGEVRRGGRLRGKGD